MKVGTKLIAIDACQEYGGPKLTIGKEYQVLNCDQAEFVIKNDQNKIHHFPALLLEKYFQISITSESLEELGFKKDRRKSDDEDSFTDWILIGSPDHFWLEVSRDFKVKIMSWTECYPIPNCKTLTDLKHLIRILGI